MQNRAKKKAVPTNYTNSMIIASGTVAIANKILNEKSDINIPDVEEEIKKQINAIKRGDVSGIEAMLFSQATTLETLFNNFAKLCLVSQDVGTMQALGQLALQAQKNCRRTLATLVDVKNPKRALFIKQQNNSMNQQINLHQEEISKKIPNSTNELLREGTYETLDIRRSSETIHLNPPVEAVETINGRKNTHR